MLTVFDECQEALSEDFYLLSPEEEKIILDEFYTYPFAYGNIDSSSDMLEKVDFDSLIREIRANNVDPNVFILADGYSNIFRTNLLLALDKIDDISALSTKVFILGKGYLAQVVSRKIPVDIFKFKDSDLVTSDSARL